MTGPYTEDKWYRWIPDVAWGCVLITLVVVEVKSIVRHASNPGKLGLCRKPRDAEGRVIGFVVVVFTVCSTGTRVHCLPLDNEQMFGVDALTFTTDGTISTGFSLPWCICKVSTGAIWRAFFSFEDKFTRTILIHRAVGRWMVSGLVLRLQQLAILFTRALCVVWAVS